MSAVATARAAAAALGDEDEAAEALLALLVTGRNLASLGIEDWADEVQTSRIGPGWAESAARGSGVTSATDQNRI